MLKTGRWQDHGVLWELRHGDFRKTLKGEKMKPHLIYYDPYSSKVNREMWSTECFRDLRDKCRTEGTLLYTYSQATPIRVALLAGGFFVGHGLSSGPKEETTQAATRLSDLTSPLAAKWFERWSRSHNQVPFECPPENAESMRTLVRRHPQFIGVTKSGV